MLKNAYFLTKIGADTAENERNFAKNWQLPYGAALYSLLDPLEVELAGEAEVEGQPPPAALLQDARHGLPVVPRVSKINKLCKILQIFSGLVLGCIKTKFCKKICV